MSGERSDYLLATCEAKLADAAAMGPGQPDTLLFSPPMIGVVGERVRARPGARSE